MRPQAPGASAGCAWGGQDATGPRRKQLPPLPDQLLLMLPRAQADTLRPTAVQKGARSGRCPRTHLPPPLQARWMTPPSGASTLVAASHEPGPRARQGRLPAATPAPPQASPRAGSGGRERGLEGQFSLSLTSSLPGGTVSMATCSGTSGRLKMPWRCTRFPGSWVPTERTGEKGSGQGASAAQGECCPGSCPRPPLLFSEGTWRVHQGLSGPSLDWRSPHCSL